MKSQALELFAVARITGAHGIAGFLRVEPLSDDPDRFHGLVDVFCGTGEADAQPGEIEEVRTMHRGLLLKLKGVDDRTAAERLKGRMLFVTREHLVKPRKGRWFVHDIIGCAVATDDGREIGTVADVLKSAAQDIWVVREGSKEHLIPVVSEFVRSVDVKKKRIVIHAIEGLLQ